MSNTWFATQFSFGRINFVTAEEGPLWVFLPSPKTRIEERFLHFVALSVLLYCGLQWADSLVNWCWEGEMGHGSGTLWKSLCTSENVSTFCFSVIFCVSVFVFRFILVSFSVGFYFWGKVGGLIFVRENIWLFKEFVFWRRNKILEKFRFAFKIGALWVIFNFVLEPSWKCTSVLKSEW